MSSGSASAPSDRLAAARIGAAGISLRRVDGAPCLLGRRTVLEEVQTASGARVDARLVANRSTGSAQVGQRLDDRVVEESKRTDRERQQRSIGQLRVMSLFVLLAVCSLAWPAPAVVVCEWRALPFRSWRRGESNRGKNAATTHTHTQGQSVTAAAPASADPSGVSDHAPLPPIHTTQADARRHASSRQHGVDTAAGSSRHSPTQRKTEGNEGNSGTKLSMEVTRAWAAFATQPSLTYESIRMSLFVCVMTVPTRTS